MSSIASRLPAAIVLDVDGTLLDSQHRVAPATRAAVGRAREAGVRVLLASARGPEGLRPIVDELGLDGPLIAYGGALVCNLRSHDARPPRLRFERRMLRSDARQAVAAAAALGLEVGWHDGRRWYAPAVGPALQREAAITGERILPWTEGAVVDGPHKLLAIAGGVRELPALDDLRSALPAGCHAHSSQPGYLEVTARGVEKDSALEWLCADLRIDPADVAAIGDGENDIALLRRAGTGIAMGHAAAHVREAADWVTATNDRDGVALAIDCLLAVERLAA